MRDIGYTIVYNSKRIRRTEEYFKKLKDFQWLPVYIPAMVWDKDEVHLRHTYISKPLLQHELIHLAQIHEIGSFRKYLEQYFLEEKDLGYGEKSSEVEAYKYMYDPTYIQRKYNINFYLKGTRDEIHQSPQFTTAVSTCCY